MFLASVRLALLIAGPVVLLLISPGSLDAAPTLCLSRLLLSVDCWGCGMTRALHAVSHADISRAIEYNWRVVIVAPLLAYLALRSVISDFREIRRRLGARTPTVTPESFNV